MKVKTLSNRRDQLRHHEFRGVIVWQEVADDDSAADDDDEEAPEAVNATCCSLCCQPSCCCVCVLRNSFIIPPLNPCQVMSGRKDVIQNSVIIQQEAVRPRELCVTARVCVCVCVSEFVCFNVRAS